MYFKDRSSPFIIAEIGANHNGDLGIAKKLISQAKEAGANCVKFQSWTKDSVFARIKYEENYFLEDDYRNSTDYTLESVVEAYSLSELQLKEISEYAAKIGIVFSSTPFCEKEVDFLVDQLNVPFIKIASMDLNNYPFLAYIAAKKRPIILSTGLSELFEIDRAVKILEANSATDISILHCVSAYPPRDVDVNLLNIQSLRTIYPDYTIGFSDHTIGTCIPIAAMALGAKIVEKHFTLDKGMEGWDHKVSADFYELLSIVDGGRRIADAMGSTRVVANESNERKSEFRRSIVVNCALKKGDIIRREHLSFKRPGTGIPPEYAEFVVDRTLARDLERDQLIQFHDMV